LARGNELQLVAGLQSLGTFQGHSKQVEVVGYREEIWADFFRRIVPQKFNIARSVFIIDSKENISKEVDIAIYDEQYTPYIFNYGLIKFIPVEAVAAVVQCKSRNLESKDLGCWADSIDSLKTSNDSIVRLANYIHIGEKQGNGAIQTATKPIKILCYIPENETRTNDSKGRDKFDIVIEAYRNRNLNNNQVRDNSDKVSYDGNLKITFRDNNLLEVLQKYNQADIKENNKCILDNLEKLKEREIKNYRVGNEKKEYTLLSFIFQFNQMLMMINNPMFFPHKAYVDMFNRDV